MTAENARACRRASSPRRSSRTPQAAASIIGLVDGKTLVWIDPATRKVTGSADIKGAANVVGIDVRPADGMLYAVTADGGIYTVDAKSGAGHDEEQAVRDAEGRHHRDGRLQSGGGPSARHHVGRHEPARQRR